MSPQHVPTPLHGEWVNSSLACVIALRLRRRNNKCQWKVYGGTCGYALNTRSTTRGNFSRTGTTRNRSLGSTRDGSQQSLVMRGWLQRPRLMTVELMTFGGTHSHNRTEEGRDRVGEFWTGFRWKTKGLFGRRKKRVRCTAALVYYLGCRRCKRVDRGRAGYR